MYGHMLLRMLTQCGSSDKQTIALFCRVHAVVQDMTHRRAKGKYEFMWRASGGSPGQEDMWVHNYETGKCGQQFM
jgi:hypothetical protein